jgi:hypothetical protein
MRRTVVRNHEATRLHIRFAPSTFPEGTFCYALLPFSGSQVQARYGSPKRYLCPLKAEGSAELS